MKWSRWGPPIAFVAGLAGLAALTFYAGTAGILRAFTALGFSGLAIVALVHLPATAAMGWSWWNIGRDLPGATPWKFLWARLVRDSAAEALPFSQLGGFVVGVRALHLGRVAAIGGALSMSADLIMELWSKLPYFIIGLLSLLALAPGFRMWGLLMLVLGASTVVFAIPYLLRARLRRWLEASAWALSRRWPSLGSREDAKAFFDSLFAAPVRLVLAFAAHLACWLYGAVETWIAFYLIGIPVTPLEALAIDSLTTGLRTFAFLIPAAAGVQEGSYVLICALFGIAPASAIALSLVRRARDFVLGIPSLAIWQFTETQAQMAGAERPTR